MGEEAGSLWPSLAAFASVYTSNDILASSLLSAMTAAALGDAKYSIGLVNPGLERIEGSAVGDEPQSTPEEEDSVEIEVGNRLADDRREIWTGRGEYGEWKLKRGRLSFFRAYPPF